MRQGLEERSRVIDSFAGRGICSPSEFILSNHSFVHSRREGAEVKRVSSIQTHRRRIVAGICCRRSQISPAIRVCAVQQRDLRQT